MSELRTICPQVTSNPSKTRHALCPLVHAQLYHALKIFILVQLEEKSGPQLVCLTSCFN
jgi:hypothetical protein